MFLNLIALAGMSVLATHKPRDDEGQLGLLREAREVMQGEQGTWTGAEKMVAGLHLQALELFLAGDMYEAAEAWEEIMLVDPLELMAIKFAHDTYFYLVSSFPWGWCAFVRVRVRPCVCVWSCVCSWASLSLSLCVCV